MQLPFLIIVFFSGAVVMALELAAARMLAPFLGSSIHTWTSLIGVILGSLSLGYWFGGRLADKKPQRAVLSTILVAAAALIGIIPLFEFPVLTALSRQALDLRISSLLGSFMLFAFPSAMLGAVTPFVVRLSLTEVESSGAKVGALYAWSTLGSIFGTFVTGYFLFALIGSSQLMFLLAAITGVLALMASYGSNPAVKVSLFLFLGLLTQIHTNFEKRLTAGGVRPMDTAYHRILILDSEENKRKVRSLATDPLGIQSLMYIDAPNELAGEYSRFYDLGFKERPGARSALMIGGGAYSYPKHMQVVYPDVRLDVVELDPGMTRIAEQHFAFTKSAQTEIFHEDARTYLQRTDRKYDLIFVDAFASSPSIPFQLVTREFIALLHEHLNQNGIVFVNLIGAVEGEQGRFLRALDATVHTAFAETRVLTVERERGDLAQNIVLAASDAPQLLSGETTDSEALALRSHLWNKPIIHDMPVLTDSYAPVEQYLLPVLLGLQHKRA